MVDVQLAPEPTPNLSWAVSGRLRSRRRSALSSEFSRNTMTLTASTMALGGGGLAFWVIASRIYPVEAVGIGTSVIAALTLVSGFMAVGWPQLGMRDGNTYLRGGQVALRAAAMVAVLGGVVVSILVAAPGHFGVALAALHSPPIVVFATCLVTVVEAAVGTCAEGVLISRHAGHLVLVDSLLGTAARLALLVPFSTFGPLGILLANGLAAGVSAVAAWVFVTLGWRSKPVVAGSRQGVLWRSDLSFAISAGLPAMIALIPTSILPTVVLHSLGAKQAAFFGVAISLALAVRMFPIVVCQALLAEVGRGANPRVILRKAMRLVLPVSGGVALVVSMGARPLAQLYGHAFEHGAAPIIEMLALSGALAGVNYLIDGVLLAIGELRRFTAVNVAGSALVLVLVAGGARHSLLLAGVGYALAEVVYAAAGWQVLRTAPAWRAAPANRGRTRGGVAHDSADDPPRGRTAVRVRYIDGLRGLAACYVVVSHCWDTWKPQATPLVPEIVRLTQPLGLGRWAVSLFILLSGVSLGLPVWRAGQRWPGGVLKFLRGRIRRIVPPYWAAVAISVALASTVLRTDADTLYDQANNIRPLGVIVHLGLAQDVIWRGPAGSSAFWSIAVESHIYLLFALLTLALRRYASMWLVASIGLNAATLWALISQSATAHFVSGLYPSLYVLFLLGVGAARWAAGGLGRAAVIEWYAAVATTFVCGVGALAATGDHLNVLGPVADLLIGPAIALALASLLRGRMRPLADFLGRPSLVWLGTSSYSLYLMHAVVIEVVWRLMIRVGLTPGGIGSLVGELVFGLGASVAVARIFYVSVEYRFLNNRLESATARHGDRSSPEAIAHADQ